MIVSIMQPYFFPYIGYFQLIAQADVFVCHDDVQYIKGGWINRNQISVSGAPALITLPVLAGSSSQRINERLYRNEADDTMRLLRQIEGAYRKAPRFGQIFPLVKEIMAFGDRNIAAFNAHLIARVAAHLGITTPILRSSEIAKDDSLAGEERVIDICTRLGGTHYVNPVGGRHLYHHDRFARGGLRLSFFEPALVDAGPFLSIIDTMMKLEPDEIDGLLTQFRLVDDEQACC